MYRHARYSSIHEQRVLSTKTTQRLYTGCTVRGTRERYSVEEQKRKERKKQQRASDIRSSTTPSIVVCVMAVHSGIDVQIP